MKAANAFQNLLDEGYSYNLVSESLLTYEDSYVAGGCLAPEGPAFKALIVDEVSIITVEAMEKLLQFAEAGLPVVVYNSDISRVYGSAIDDDELIQEMFAELLSLANVETADSTDEVKEALTDFGTVPYAQYSVSQLETTLYTDALDKANYYYMFNNAYPENSGMMGNDQASNYTGEDSIISNVEVTLAGEGVPYKLDPHTGDISQVGAYTVNRDGTVTFEIDELAGGDAVIYAVTNHRVYKGKDFYVTSVDQPADTYEIVRTDDGLALRSNTPGTYKATLFNHQKVTAEVETAFEDD